MNKQTGVVHLQEDQNVELFVLEKFTVSIEIREKKYVALPKC